MAVRTDVVKLKEQEDEKYYAGQSLLQLALRRLRRDKLTLLAMAVVLVLILLSVFAPIIEQNILQVSFSRTDPNNAFIPPGGTARIIYLPDNRYRTQGLNVVVLFDRGAGGREVGEVHLDIQARQLTTKPGMADLLVAHASFDTPSFSVFLNDEPRAIVARVGVNSASSLAEIPVGTHTLTFRRGTAADGEVLYTLRDVEITPQTLTTAVLFGRSAGDGEAVLQAKAFSVNSRDLVEDTARLHVIHTSLSAPRLVDVRILDEVRISNIPYGESASTIVQRGLFTTGISDANGRTYILGTDDLGRDHLARLLYAGQISLSIAFAAAIISVSIGVTMGIIAGFYSGLIDDAINWVITTVSSLPTLLLLLIIVALLNPGPGALILVLGFLGWFGVCRLVRGETYSIRAREYVVSARAIGAPVSRIMLVHVMPNLLSVVIVAMALDIGNLILVESALSFLGFGIKPPAASWGNMLSNAQTFFTKGAHLVVFPGLMITITVLCLYIIGDGLRDAFDPTLKN
ncbi:MAG: ABC transporter permease subunit [Chloroflexi bacterium CFX4]|nr:ABC transporter permease subunit [Chloroflexi bacterium CFX4]MDL1923736.1 ABC transporter permease subunit [Chloroflexi bacterium CFX3]